MAYCDFYAVRSDIQDVLRYIYDETDLVVFEMYSEPDCELRRFETLADVITVYDAALKGLYSTRSVHLLLWSPSLSPPPFTHRIDLNETTGHRFRYRMDGSALLRLYLGGLHDTAIIKSHFGHAGVGDASRRGTHSGCDYDGLRRLANRIQYHIRERLAVLQTNIAPVLPGARDAMNDGITLRP
jgi:hypothetical protein